MHGRESSAQPDTRRTDMHWMPKSIRARVIAAAVLVQLIAVAVVVAHSVRLLEKTAGRLARQRLDETVPLLTEALAQPLLSGDTDRLQRLISGMVNLEGLAAVAVRGADGKLLAESKAISRPADEGADGMTRSIEQVVRIGDQKLGTIDMRISTEFHAAIRNEAIRDGILIALVGIVASAVALGGLIYWLMRNLTSLRGAADAVAKGDFSVRAVAHGSDDAADVVRSFNQMVESLQHAQSRQAHSDHLYRELVLRAQQPMLVLESGKPVFANRAFAELAGYADPESVIALGSYEGLVAPGSRREIARMAGVGQSDRTGRPVAERFEVEGITSDGRHIWVECHGNATRWAGQPACQLAVFDITERKLAQRALESSEARYRDLVEGSLQGVLILDANWRVVFANQAAADIYGYPTPESLLQLESGAPLVSPEDRDRLGEYNQARVLGEQRPTRYEHTGLKRDGTRIRLQTYVRIVEWEGRPAVQSTLVDITEQKQAEDELRQAQKMEVVGQLTGGVAHDFNNLLTVVLGNLELIRRTVTDNAKLRELIDSAARAADRGAMLTQRLLAFSRRQALLPESVDVNQVVAELADLLRRTLGEPVVVKTVLAGHLWSAQVDPNQLENTLLNLAVNARDAMPDGGQLIIETANSYFDEDYASRHQDVAAGQYVMLAVSDTGEGMSGEVLARAFDPFFTTKEVGRGSGLGLSMIYGFAKQSGGHVSLYSEPGRGTTVKVYFPRAQTDPWTPRPVGLGLRTPAGQGEKILVVEDDDSVRELALAILNNLGYAPLDAPDAPSALRLLEAHGDIDLLFTDVVLGGGTSGVELAQSALERRPKLKVLYTSGYTESALSHHTRLEQGYDLLEKPFRIEELASKVHDLLSR